MREEWRSFTSGLLLPALAGTHQQDPPPDPDAMVESYTRQMAEIVKKNQGASLRDIPLTILPLDSNGLSWRGRQIYEEAGLNDPDPRQYWARNQDVTGLYQAALAILNGRPVPHDPIHGKPYQWDPKNRMLAMPHGLDRASPYGGGIKPIKLPSP